jgi:hypothetical protein
MRRGLHLLLGALAAAGTPGAAAAQGVTASGSVGAGMFGDAPASTVEVGLDLAGRHHAVGLGAEARWLADGGFRGEDWDEASEWARLVRYAILRWPSRGDDRDADGAHPASRPADREPAFSAALGELGGVTLGHGSLIDGFAGGLDVDHGRVGAQVAAALGRCSAELLVDDVIAPRIAGARVAMRSRRAVTGVSLAGDRDAPAMGGRETAGGIALDGELGAASGAGRARGALHADLVHLPAAGASGLHLGARGALRLTDPLRVGARVELRAGTDTYLPGWIGPLYERDRRELAAADGSMTGGQLDAARAGGVGGASGAGQLDIELAHLATASLGYAGRPGVSDLLTARLAAPHRSAAQAAFWAAAGVRDGGSEAMALAVELRVRLPGRLFVRGEAARLYRLIDGSYRPIWLAQIALGSVLGEPMGGP